MHHILKSRHSILVLGVILALFTIGVLPSFAGLPPITNKGCYEVSVVLGPTGEYISEYFTFPSPPIGPDHIKIGTAGQRITIVGFVDETHAILVESTSGIAYAMPYGNLAIGSGSVKLVSGPESKSCHNTISDGRLNNSDLAALGVVYPAADGFDIWAIDHATDKGSFLFTAKHSDINAKLEKAVASGENQLINELNGISLWALSSNECQLNYTSQDNQTRIFVFACAG